MLKWAVSGGSGGKGVPVKAVPTGEVFPACRPTTPVTMETQPREVNNNEEMSFERLPPLPAHHSRKYSLDTGMDKTQVHANLDNIPANMDNIHAKCRFLKGSDPLFQTARGQLQSRRSRLNDQINREMRLRTGAENLLKATNNRKLKETISLELSSVNSNLQLLKEEMTDLNSSVDIYQDNNNCIQCIPMIPLGLKETKDIDLVTTLKTYVSEHYFDQSEVYHRALENIQATRQACRTPVRGEDGLELLFKYYNQLYFVEKRFFSPHRNLGIYFEWYDSLTGVPSCQKTVGFEKGSILFNIGALHTQIGARQDRSGAEGLLTAIENFKKAAGAFKYLREHFTHAPSKDMQSQTLDMLVKLMMAQSQECEYDLRQADSDAIHPNVAMHFDTAHEAALVSDLYCQTQTLMMAEPVQQLTPAPWLALVRAKSLYYQALAHYHSAVSVLEPPTPLNISQLSDHFHDLHVWNPNRKFEDSIAAKPPRDRDERITFAKAHLRQAILANEDSLRIHNQSRQLRKIDTFHDILRKTHDRSLLTFSKLEEEDDFTELSSAPEIHPKSQRVGTITNPDFSRYKVEDYFHGLGPLSIFSARHTWTAPRTIEMRKADGQEFGFSIRGDSPVIVAVVETGSLAQKCGMKVGDFIVGVHETNAKYFKHDETVALIRQAGSHIILKLVTPLDRNFLNGESPASGNQNSLPSTPNMVLKSQGSGSTKDKYHRHRKTSASSGTGWNLRRKRSSSKDKNQLRDSGEENGFHVR